jgi:hypothetical protein
MFTGLLPSQHRAHFQSATYLGKHVTVAASLSAAGYHTEVVTRNPQFDGTVPGLTRGFRVNTPVLADLGWSRWPTAIMLALQKPRLRRVIAAGGWFSLLQKRNRDFVTTMARIGIPADDRVLAYLVERMTERRRRNEKFFYFANLYDVHAPYAPERSSFFSPFRSLEGLIENLSLPQLCRITAHDYLRSGFHMPEYARAAMARRYHRAIELMDQKLDRFFDELRRARLLEDTVVIVAADHGEAFGEHDLYYHDASVYDTHLHVPLWVHHPDRHPEVVDDVVSTRGLFDLIRGIALRHTTRGTLLDASARASQPVALAEHFHYPYVDDMQPRYAQNIAAAIVGDRKLVVRQEGLLQYDLARDPDERDGEPVSIAAFEAACRRDGAPIGAVRAATDHARRWEGPAAAA